MKFGIWNQWSRLNVHWQALLRFLKFIVMVVTMVLSIFCHHDEFILKFNYKDLLTSSKFHIAGSAIAFSGLSYETTKAIAFRCLQLNSCVIAFLDIFIFLFFLLLTFLDGLTKFVCVFFFYYCFSWVWPISDVTWHMSPAFKRCVLDRDKQ